MTAQSASANFVFARVICCENCASRTADAGSRARYATKAVNFVRCASISKSTFGGAGKGAAGESLITRNASTGIDLSAADGSCVQIVDVGVNTIERLAKKSAIQYPKKARAILRPADNE